MYINFKNLGAQATLLKAQKNFVVVNRGGGGGGGVEGDWERQVVEWIVEI